MTLSVAEAAGRLEVRDELVRERAAWPDGRAAWVSQEIGRALPEDLAAFYRERIVRVNAGDKRFSNPGVARQPRTRAGVAFSLAGLPLSCHVGGIERHAMIKTAFSVAILAISLATAAPAAAQPDASAITFEAMKETVGLWRPAENPDSSLRIRFSLTAGGTVLIEEWTRKGQPHSLTLYHRDGANLIATHYCPQGNQPRLAMLPQADRSVIRFVFKDATDLDTTSESHVVALAFDMSNREVLVRQETYQRNDADEKTELRLVRES